MEILKSHLLQKQLLPPLTFEFLGNSLMQTNQTKQKFN